MSMNGLPKVAKIYIGILVVVAFSLLLHFIQETTFDIKVLQGLVFFIVLAVVTESLKISLPRGGYISVTFAVTYTCVVLFGAAVAGLVEIAASIFSRFTTRDMSPWYKLVFNCAQFVLCVSVAQLIYTNMGGEIGDLSTSNLIPFITSATGYFLVNTVAVTIILAIVQNVSPWGMWITNLRWTFPNLLTLSLLSILMSGIYEHAGYWGVSLFFIPLLLARFVFQSYMEVRQNYLDTLGALASALDAKDAYTKGHSDRVSEYATLIARKMKLPEDQVEIIQHMALLHDVGKIGIGDEILCKPDKLTDEEFEIIKQHSAIGAKIIEPIQGLGENKEYILYHHERYAGGGYPTGTSGKDLPLGARIITVADAFDAMTSDRSYRPKRSFEEAIKVLQEMSGQQFDPEIVEVFIDAIRQEQAVNKEWNSAVPVSK